jgi:AcrR family transcriptional regulator
VDLVHVRDAAATKERILNAATKEFAAKGVSGARIDAIATRARTNKRMLYYYFGSKSELFREVLRTQLTARVTRSREQPTTDRVERLVARQALHARDREWVRLLTWEALESGRNVPDDGEREQWYQTWVDDLRAAQAVGDVPDDVDAGQLALSELALTLFPGAFPQLTRWITGRAVTDPAFVAERQAFLETIGPRLLQARAASASATVKRRS